MRWAGAPASSEWYAGRVSKGRQATRQGDRVKVSWRATLLLALVAVALAVCGVSDIGAQPPKGSGGGRGSVALASGALRQAVEQTQRGQAAGVSASLTASRKLSGCRDAVVSRCLWSLVTGQRYFVASRQGEPCRRQISAPLVFL